MIPTLDTVRQCVRCGLRDNAAVGRRPTRFDDAPCYRVADRCWDDEACAARRSEPMSPASPPPADAPSEEEEPT